jgi:repressor LexA
MLQDNIEDPLTIRDLQDELELSTPSLVQHHMRQLELKGYLRRNPSNPRDYQIMTETPEKKIAHINVYGMAQCGRGGSLFDGNPMDKIVISSRLLGFSSMDAFAVKARGDSMTPHIKSGDIVIARRSEGVCSEGDIVVCVNDGEVLVKQVFKNPRGITLHSFNTQVSPPFPASQDDFRIEGVVKGVMSYSFH